MKSMPGLTGFLVGMGNGDDPALDPFFKGGPAGPDQSDLTERVFPRDVPRFATCPLTELGVSCSWLDGHSLCP